MKKAEIIFTEFRLNKREEMEEKMSYYLFRRRLDSLGIFVLFVYSFSMDINNINIPSVLLLCEQV